MYQTAKGVWRFEHVTQLQGGPIEWETAVRIRHVCSGRLLIVEPTRPAFSLKQSARFGQPTDRGVTGTLFDDDEAQSVKRDKGTTDFWYETHLQDPKLVSSRRRGRVCLGWGGVTVARAYVCMVSDESRLTCAFAPSPLIHPCASL